MNFSLLQDETPTLRSFKAAVNVKLRKQLFYLTVYGNKPNLREFYDEVKEKCDTNFLDIIAMCVQRDKNKM